MNALTSPIHAAPPATEASEPVPICFPFSGDAVGGSHVSVLGLVRQLDPVRYRAIIVPELADGNIARLFVGHDMLSDPVTRPRRFVPGRALGFAKFVGTLAGVPARMRFLRQNRIAIVHLNDGRTSANWALAARLAGARIVWHHRGDPGALGLRVAAPLLADRVLTVSSFALPRKSLWSAAHKAQVVHSPFETDIAVDRDAARATLVRELGVSPDTVILGYFGAFVPRKRPLIFADMMARLQALTDRPVIGLMFGEARVPEMAAALDRRIAENNVANIVRIMGYRTPGAFWIAACDQLVVPSIGEPFGRTLIEAMLVGTPVIAAASGGNIEALRDGNGVLVAADDADALARGCADLMGDPASAARFVTRAHEAARTRFSAKRHHDAVTAVYAELLAGRESVPRTK